MNMPFPSGLASDTTPTARHAGSMSDWAATLARVATLAESIDKDGQIARATIAELRDAGAFSAGIPDFLGGEGGDCLDALRRASQIAAVCGSCGWIAGTNFGHLGAVMRFPEAAHAEMLGVSKGRPPLVALARAGRATVAEDRDGLTIQGEWTFVSGIDQAEWVLVTVDTAKGKSMAIVDAGAFEIDHSSWTSIGLRGTSTKSVRTERARIPTRRVVPWDRMQTGELPARVAEWNVPIHALLAMAVAAPVVGLGAAAVDEFAAVARARKPAHLAAPQREDRTSHLVLGNAAAGLMALRGAIEAEAGAFAAMARDGQAPGKDRRVALRAQIAWTAREISRLVATLELSLGTAAFAPMSRWDRIVRDLRTACAHNVFSVEFFCEELGRHIFGLPPGPRMVF